MARQALRQVRLNACQADICHELIPGTSIFCERHDRMLQSDIRTILEKKFRPGKPQSKLFQIVLEQAREEIRYTEYAGHRMPRPAEFKW